MYSLQPLMSTVCSVSNFSENMFSLSNLIHLLREDFRTVQATANFLPPEQWAALTFLKRLGGYTSGHLSNYCFVSSLTSCLGIALSLCAQISHFPHHGVKSPWAVSSRFCRASPPPHGAWPAPRHGVALCVDLLQRPCQRPEKQQAAS